jgi:DNA-binding beta-propeller fold protein YncE
LSLVGSYPLPSGSTSPASVAFSPNGSYLATANDVLNYANVTIFSVGAGGVLSGATSYPLPSGSTGPISVAFSPNGSYLATANINSNNVTMLNFSATTICPVDSTGASAPIGIIVGATLGGAALLGGLTALGAFVWYKKYRAGYRVINDSGDVDLQKYTKDIG